jgi:hypothetical protein
MTGTRQDSPAPGRVERSRTPRRELTEDGRRRLREAALRHQPWRFSTGPRTAAGKTRSAANGTKRQTAPRSVREIRHDLADLRGLLQDMRSACRLAEEAVSGRG